MDISEQKITEIAREVGKFTARTRKADGVGTAEFDLLHVVRKHPGITQPEICRILGTDKGAVAKQTANLEDRAICSGRSIRRMAVASLSSLRSGRNASKTPRPKSRPPSMRGCSPLSMKQSGGRLHDCWRFSAENAKRRAKQGFRI